MMAFHLILKAADHLWPGLKAQAVTYSGGLCALKRVANLLPHNVLTRVHLEEDNGSLHKLVLCSGILPREVTARQSRGV